MLPAEVGSELGERIEVGDRGLPIVERGGGAPAARVFGDLGFELACEFADPDPGVGGSEGAVEQVGEAVELYVNDRLIARGEIVLVENRLGVTMTEIIKAA